MFSIPKCSTRINNNNDDDNNNNNNERQHVKESFAKCNLTATSAPIPQEGILTVKNT